MNTNRMSSVREGRVWLVSFAFWFAVALFASGLMLVQTLDWYGQPGPWRWEPFAYFEQMLHYVPFVPASVWLWAATRAQAARGEVRVRRVALVCGAWGLGHLAWHLLRSAWSSTESGGPFAIGLWFWTSLQYVGIFACGLAWHTHAVAVGRARELLATQLRALRAQLQPHFLFNTLHAIGVTAKTDGAAAARMTTLLGDLLRQTLRERDGGLVSLAEEHELLQPYVQLQQLRFGDRLRLDVDLPADVLGGAVPDLVLQPLVENALQHGLEQRPGAGHVRIVGRRHGEHLVIGVHDDGVGLPGASGEVALGTGLGATKARLAALFGDTASLTLRSNEHGGTTAELRLPWREVAHAA